MRLAQAYNAREQAKSAQPQNQQLTNELDTLRVDAHATIKLEAEQLRLVMKEGAQALGAAHCSGRPAEEPQARTDVFKRT